MKEGDYVETEIYGMVKISRIFADVKQMVSAGYSLPTGFNNTGYEIKRKHGLAIFSFAAAPKSRYTAAMNALYGITGTDDSDDGEPQKEFTPSSSQHSSDEPSL